MQSNQHAAKILGSFGLESAIGFESVQPAGTYKLSMDIVSHALKAYLSEGRLSALPDDVAIESISIRHELMRPSDRLVVSSTSLQQRFSSDSSQTALRRNLRLWASRHPGNSTTTNHA